MTNCITYEIFITMGYWRLLLGGICISILVCITMWRYLSRFCVCVCAVVVGQNNKVSRCGVMGNFWENGISHEKNSL